MITPDDIRHIAELARLRLTPDQVEQYARHAARVLTYVAHLNRLDSSSIEPTAHAVETSGFQREDTVRREVEPAEILANAPDRDGDLFSVPKVL